MLLHTTLRQLNFLKNAMKILTLALAGLSCLLCRQSLAESQPRGSVLELHSCELYAGGCIVSSEATLDGRYMVRAWNFTGGSFRGTDLAGLSVALLQSSSENLAGAKAKPGAVIAYLPQSASATQREALIDWLKASNGDLRSTSLQARIVPIQFTKTDTGYGLTAGNFLNVKTAPLEACATGACGEALWYTPRAQTSVFTVALNRASTVNEPLLQLKWSEAGRRSVFLGRFGEDTPAQNLYVSSAELCSVTGKLF